MPPTMAAPTQFPGYPSSPTAAAAVGRTAARRDAYSAGGFADAGISAGAGRDADHVGQCANAGRRRCGAVVAGCARSQEPAGFAPTTGGGTFSTPPGQSRSAATKRFLVNVILGLLIVLVASLGVTVYLLVRQSQEPAATNGDGSGGPKTAAAKQGGAAGGTKTTDLSNGGKTAAKSPNGAEKTQPAAKTADPVPPQKPDPQEKPDPQSKPDPSEKPQAARETPTAGRRPEAGRVQHGGGRGPRRDVRPRSGRRPPAREGRPGRRPVAGRSRSGRAARFVAAESGGVLEGRARGHRQDRGPRRTQGRQRQLRLGRRQHARDDHSEGSRGDPPLSNGQPSQVADRHGTGPGEPEHAGRQGRLGAYHAMDRDGDRTRARQYWQEAAARA